MCLKAFGECGQTREVRLPARCRCIRPASEQGESAITFRARNNVDVDMGDLLARNRSIVDAYGKIGCLKLRRQSSLDLGHAIHQGVATLFGQVCDALRLLLGYDQRMAIAAWEYIEECVPQIAFSDLRRGNLTVDDLREQSVLGHGGPRVGCTINPTQGIVVTKLSTPNRARSPPWPSGSWLPVMTVPSMTVADNNR